MNEWMDSNDDNNFELLNLHCMVQVPWILSLLLGK